MAESNVMLSLASHFDSLDHQHDNYHDHYHNHDHHHAHHYDHHLHHDHELEYNVVLVRLVWPKAM